MSQRNKLFLHKPFSYSYTRITLAIILINFLVFALCYIYPRFFQYACYYGALNVYRLEKGRMYWQFITYMFLHSNKSHVFFNMLGLLVFGLPLEKTIGSKEFCLFYMVTGALSGFFSYLVYKFTGYYNIVLLGASGAVYAVLFAYAVFFPRSIIYIWGFIPVPAPVMVLIYAIIELGSQFFTASNVAHMTHLFGFLAAWLFFVIRMRIHPLKIWKNSYK